MPVRPPTRSLTQALTRALTRSSTRSSTRPSTRALAAGVALACLPGPLTQPAQAAVSAVGPVVEVTSHRTAFSPNGDGHKDTLPLRFRLTERARVSVRIARVGTVELGIRRPGVRRWRWDGRGAPDGTYVLTILARTGPGEVHRARWWAELDRGADIARVQVRMTRRTLYPATPGKHDQIWVHSTHAGNATEVTIRDAAGAVVVEDRLRQWWSWDGDGLPAGEYTATFFVHDRAGNRRFLRRPITISTEHLRPETWSTTVAAADAERFPWSCGLTPSARYVDGLAVAPAGSCDPALLVPRFPIPVDVDPDVTYRFSITGAGDPARVYVSDGIDAVATPTPPGEGVTTTPWGSPYHVDWARAAEPTGWLVVDDGTYDVAKVGLEVRYWAEPGQDSRT